MTYCVAMRLKKGLVFMSDTRTNAGVDNISVFKKMFTWEKPGERLLTIMTAGNLATTQAVVSLLEERAKAPSDREPSILAAPSMFQVAQIVGETLRDVISNHVRSGQESSSAFNATIILGGQIEGGGQRLFLIYPEGNFIEASEDTPFFQIGETKYGKPILVRAHEPNMSYQEAIRLLLVSFDSTVKANLSVDLPLDLQIYENDSLKKGRDERIESDHPYYQHISAQWGESLKKALDDLPSYEL
jgi:putative proteasome-type protease